MIVFNHRADGTPAEGRSVRQRQGDFSRPPGRERIETTIETGTVASQVLAVGIHGASGRMGTRIIQLIQADPALTLAAALDRGDHPQLGADVGPLAGLGPLGVPLSAALDRAVDVLIDFSVPAGTLALARLCAERGIPLVVGTTGLDPEQRAALTRAGERIPVLVAPNMSRAVNLLFRLAGEVARALGAAADIEIVERHHHFKTDAPSGTALRLAEVVGRAIGSDRLAHGRAGQVGARPRGEIGIHALRVGDNPGEHTVVFGLMGETLELSHRATNRDGFARGALDAARFLAGRPPGVYSMDDLLG
jgi:4-hydroxy-tetrahydrodipicolinate reductase